MTHQTAREWLCHRDRADECFDLIDKIYDDFKLELEAMILQDEIDEANSVREDIRSDELYERKLRTNFEYFLSENGFAEFREMYQKLSQKAWDYGWCDVEVKGYL